MKRANIYLAMAVVLLIAVLAYAQTGPVGSSLGFSTTGSSCATPAQGQAFLCGTATGFQQSTNGSAYAPIGGTSAVASVFGRTGNVVAASGDYSWAQISAQPTTMTCTTVSITQTGITASGCTFK